MEAQSREEPPAIASCTHRPVKRSGQTALVSADLIRHLQEVKDVHLLRRVISAGQQGMEVWDRRRDTLLIDHIVQVSVRSEGQTSRSHTGDRMSHSQLNDVGT